METAKQKVLSVSINSLKIIMAIKMFQQIKSQALLEALLEKI